MNIAAFGVEDDQIEVERDTGKGKEKDEEMDQDEKWSPWRNRSSAPQKSEPRDVRFSIFSRRTR